MRRNVCKLLLEGCRQFDNLQLGRSRGISGEHVQATGVADNGDSGTGW